MNDQVQIVGTNVVGVIKSECDWLVAVLETVPFGDGIRERLYLAPPDMVIRQCN